MQVQITGKNVNIGKALPQYITGEMKTLVEKYFQKATNASVVMARDGEGFKAEILVHVNKHVDVAASANAGDAYSAFESALVNAAKRLRRKKRRVIDKHREHHHKREVCA